MFINKLRKHRISYSVILTLILICITGGALYIQTKIWLKNQQTKSQSIAIQQFDKILQNTTRAAYKAYPLLGKICSAETQHELRRILATAPNVANLELSANDVIYCSSLTGMEKQVMHDHRPLYLTDNIAELPGHIFLVQRITNGKYSIFSSVDGYYLHNILESISMEIPSVFIGPEGWMQHDGRIKDGKIPRQYNYNIVTKSNKWPYAFASKINNHDIILILLKKEKAILFGGIVFSIFIGFGAFKLLNSAELPIQLLEEAIKNDEIVPYIQPIVRSDDFKPVGCEILARWVRNGSVLPPSQFIQLAEQSELIIPLTRKLVEKVVEELFECFTPDEPFYISFNLGLSHLKSTDLFNDFQSILRKKNIILMLEITEREVMIFDKTIANNIDALKKFGAKIALDDFGTGYSSLEYLQHIEIDAIKIDKTFIRYIGENSLSNHIVANVTDLANRLDLKVIAEGVETESQAEFLRDSGVNALQGYLFSHPLTVPDFIKYLNKYY